MIGLNATSITTAGEAISVDFDLDNGIFEYNFFSVTAWNAAAAFVPLVTLPLMETYGMRLGYLTAYALFTIFTIPQALAKNFATLVVCRVLAGAFGGTLQNAPDGVAANMFRTAQERVFPLTVYVFSLLFGVTLGPVLGAVVEPLGWHWIFWIQLMINGVCAPILFFGMPESRGELIYGKISNTLSTQSENAEAAHLLKETVVRGAILLTTEPTVTSFTVWSAFAFGLVFISTQSVPIVFTGTYAWPGFTGGIVQLSLGIGQIIGLFAFLIQKNIYTASVAKNTERPGTPIPESILHLAIPSTLIGLAGGLFMYGWSTFQSHWIVPAIGLGLVGYASMIIVNTATIYVTDAYPGYAASAIAAVAFGENTFAAFLPLAAKPMYVRLGYAWASSLLGFVALVLTLAPVVLLWKGRTIRAKSVAIQKMG
ncbi:hypothetical protein MW887_005651 [Aspergillus wentii]|nr:hypothetical protein MW887_005651 [Aspergillus wentii]